MTTPVEQAKAAGYSDAEIAQHMAGAEKYAAAQAAGYSDADILAHYAGASSVAAPERPKLSRADFMKQYAEEGKQRKRDNLKELFTDAGKSAGDTALSMGAQLVMTPVAGIAGAVSAPFVGGERAAQIVQNVQGAGYTPKSMAGQKTAALIGKVAEKANRPGEYIAEKTGSPALGAIVTTGLQGAAAVADPAVRSAFSSVGRGALNAAERVAALRSPVKPQPAPSAPSPQATQAAQNYASSNGLDWNSLSAGVRAKLSQVAQESGDFSGLDAAAIKRQSVMEQGGLPLTRGQAEADPVAIRNEANASATTAGQPIRSIYGAQNKGLIANLNTLKGKVAGTGATAAKATTPEEAGASIQGAARGKEAKALKAADDLYTKARATEPNATASLRPVTDLLTSNPEIQHLGWVQSWLNKGAKARQNLDNATAPPGAEPAGAIPMVDAKLAELHDLRSQAAAIARTGGKEGLYAGQVVGAIDKAMQDVPAGAKAWKAANTAYAAMKREFSDQAAVSDIVSNASRTDRTTALSNTVKAVTSGAPEEIRQIKRTLLTGGDDTTRTAGRQAWREVRAQVIEQIKADATKGVATMADGTPVLTPGALQTALRKFGPQKLDEIFGPATARELDKILERAKIAKTIPDEGGPAVGSSTVKNALAFLEKGLISTTSKVPLIGKPIAGIMQAGSDTMTAKGAATRAATTPLSEIAAQATKKASRAKSRAELEAAAKTTTLSELGQQKGSR